MSPEQILAQTIDLLAVARLEDTNPERIAFLEAEVARLRRQAASTPPGPIRAVGTPRLQSQKLGIGAIGASRGFRRRV